MFLVKYTKVALKFLNKHQELKEYIEGAFEIISKDITSIKNYDIKKLRGMIGTYRLRKGNFRIIFKMDNDELVIIIIDADNRGDAYK